MSLYSVKVSLKLRAGVAQRPIFAFYRLREGKDFTFHIPLHSLKVLPCIGLSFYDFLAKPFTRRYNSIKPVLSSKKLTIIKMQPVIVATIMASRIQER